MNGPRNREQYVKSRIALEILDKKIMLLSKVLVLPDDELVTGITEMDGRTREADKKEFRRIRAGRVG